MAKVPFGLKQGRRLCQMGVADRLAFIGEGLPVILASARGFWAAAERLSEHPREADVLTGFAEEEAAKILILMDVVRCPPALQDARLGTIMNGFYSHLARLLYAKACHWRPAHMGQLREYVDLHRKAHELEGFAGEYIVPNGSVFTRESRLYADIEAYEDGTLHWSAPRASARLFVSSPAALQVAEALSVLGAFCPDGLRAAAELWGAVEFRETQSHHADSRPLIARFVERLVGEGLPDEAAAQEDVATLGSSWPMPMYHLDFRPIEVPLEQLQAERDAQLWAEAGYHPGDV